MLLSWSSLALIASNATLVIFTAWVKVRQRVALRRTTERIGSGTWNPGSDEHVIYGGFAELFIPAFGVVVTTIWIGAGQQSTNGQNGFATAIILVMGVLAPWLFAYLSVGVTFFVSNQLIRRESPFSADASVGWDSVERVGLVFAKGGTVGAGIVGVTLRGRDSSGRLKTFQLDVMSKNISLFYTIASQRISVEAWTPAARTFVDSRLLQRR